MNGLRPFLVSTVAFFCCIFCCAWNWNRCIFIPYEHDCIFLLHFNFKNAIDVWISWLHRAHATRPKKCQIAFCFFISNKNMTLFNKRERDYWSSVDEIGTVVDWLGKNSQQLEEICKSKKVRSARSSAVDYWSTPWGIMLRHADISVPGSQVSQTLSPAISSLHIFGQRISQYEHIQDQKRKLRKDSYWI